MYDKNVTWKCYQTKSYVLGCDPGMVQFDTVILYAGFNLQTGFESPTLVECLVAQYLWSILENLVS